MFQEFYQQLTGNETRRVIIFQKEEPKLLREAVQPTLCEAIPPSFSALSQTLSGRIGELIRDFYHVPTVDIQMNVLQFADCLQFKQQAELWPDAWQEGERRLQLYAFQQARAGSSGEAADLAKSGKPIQQKNP